MKQEYYSFSKEELLCNPKIPVIVMEDKEKVFRSIAEEMFSEIEKNNLQDRKTVFIVPVGPVGQYPYFVEMVNKKKLSLKNVWLINMDEYLDDRKQWIDMEDKLSFRGFMEREVYTKINQELIMPKEQRIFPDPNCIDYIPKLIEELGGVDIVFGGVGITGHVAFNEPMEGVSPEEYLKLRTRVQAISPETRAVNSISGLNGAVDAMPHYCVTVGINEIFSARKVRLYCFRDWHRAVVRKACFGQPSTNFPVTLMQKHTDTVLTITEFVAELG